MSTIRVEREGSTRKACAADPADLAAAAEQAAVNRP
jgi:hypothetical protein